MAFPGKSEINNKYLTHSLFYETAFQGSGRRNGDHVKYTLKDHDYQGYPSLKKFYLEMEDLTEYEFANTYLEGGYLHWERLCNCAWFQPHLTQWRKELELKIKARELKKLMQVAREESKEGNAAAKFLIQKGYRDPNEKGRPSKQEVNDEAVRLAELERTLEEDYKRITN